MKALTLISMAVILAIAVTSSVIVVKADQPHPSGHCTWIAEEATSLGLNITGTTPCQQIVIMLANEYTRNAEDSQ